MKFLNSLTVVVAMLSCGNALSAQDQQNKGERPERGDVRGADAQRRGGDSQEARRGRGQGGQRRGGGKGGQRGGQGGGASNHQSNRIVTKQIGEYDENPFDQSRSPGARCATPGIVVKRLRRCWRGKALASIMSVVMLAMFASLTLAADRPNIVFMMSDDQAWNGLSVAMHPDLAWSKSLIGETPNLEKLASQGMRFSAAYAPASVCSPTRISLQTGKSPAALHWTKAACRIGS